MKKKVFLLLGFFSLINIIYNAVTPLHPDEAYYWVWTQKPQLSYFDHPPMVSWLISLFSAFGRNEFAVRLPAVLCMSISAFIIYILGKKLFSEKSGFIAMIVFLFYPLVNIGYLVMTPDAPVVLFWALTLYFFYKTIYEKNNIMFIPAGVMLGFAMLSKYTAVLLVPALLIFMVVFKEERRHFKSLFFYFGIVASLIVFSPVIIWNYNNNWISFAFQFAHGVAEKKIFNINLLSEYLMGQMLIAGPVFFIGLFYYLIRYGKYNLKNKEVIFAALPFLITFLFFAYTSFYKRAEANWTAPAYISAALLLGYFIEKYKNKVLLYTGIILTIALVIIVKVPEILPSIPENAVPKSQFMGFDVIFKDVKKNIGKETVVFSDSYQNASEAWFYTGAKEVYIVTETRFSNYTMWAEKLNLSDVKNGLMITGSSDKRTELEKLFKNVEMTGKASYKGKISTKEFYLFKVSN